MGADNLLEPILLRKGVFLEAGKMLVAGVLDAGGQKEHRNGYASLG